MIILILEKVKNIGANTLSVLMTSLIVIKLWKMISVLGEKGDKMPRYIEEDAIRQGKFHLNYLIPDEEKDDSYWYQCGWNGALDTVLDCLPKVDAVEVVRCKDCKECEERHTANYLPFLYCKLHEHSVSHNAFCCWGERREDAEIH